MGQLFKGFDVFGSGRKNAQSRVREARWPDVQQDAIIVLNPDRTAGSITMRGFTVLLLCFMAFKAAVASYLGLETYVETVVRLQSGTLVEQAGAFVMSADIVTQFLAGLIGSLVS